MPLTSALSLALLLAQTSPAAGEGSAPPAPAPPSAADSIVAAAFAPIDTSAPGLKSAPGAAVEPGLVAAPAAALLGLALLAYGLTRRRRAGRSSILIVESAALGPRRSLVIADVMGERLLLGVSEAGVTVLKRAELPPAEDEVVLMPPVEVASPRMGFFSRLAGKVPQGFDTALHESLEDQELRAKLALGVKGVVR